MDLRIRVINFACHRIRISTADEDEILIIRHGEPDYSVDSLTDKGWREARLLADDPAIGTVDTKVKDIGHPSYVPGEDFWIYFNNTILDDDDEEAASASNASNVLCVSSATQPVESQDEQRGDYRQRLNYDAEGHPTGVGGKRLQTEYRGHQLSEIRDNIVTLRGGKP